MLLRAHHLLCIGFFEGKGYDEKFTRHMEKTISRLEDDTPVTLTAGCDTLCSACPNNQKGVCADADKVRGYDEAVLKACGLSAGDTLEYSKLRELVSLRILKPGLRESICGGCEWNDICGRA